VIVGGMLLSPICSLLVIPTLARMFMPYVPGTSPGPGTEVAPVADAGQEEAQPVAH
jgi:heavy metal efflux system protein